MFGINHRESWAKWLGAGAVLGLLGLSRENALILIPVIALSIWFYFPPQPLANRLRWLGLFVVGSLLVRRSRRFQEPERRRGIQTHDVPVRREFLYRQ